MNHLNSLIEFDEGFEESMRHYDKVRKTECECPDILNDPSTPLKVVECYFLLRDNEFHTLHYIVTNVLKDSFSAEEIGEAMRIYMLP